MGRPSNSAERRAQIVAAMVQVVAAMGYERATVQEVARVAGLAPGLLHYHFKSKREALIVLVQGWVGGRPVASSQTAGARHVAFLTGAARSSAADVADVLESLSTGQILKLATSNMLLCRFRLDDRLIMNMVTEYSNNKLMASSHAAVMMAGQAAAGLA